MKSSLLVAIFSVMLLCTSAYAKPVLFGWGGERIIKAMEFPNNPNFQTPSGEYIDAGYRYQQITVFFLPLWNYNEKWCGYIGSDESYLDLNRDELAVLAAEADLTLPTNVTIDAWDSIGGKLTFIIGLLLLVGYTMLTMKDEEEFEEDSK